MDRAYLDFARLHVLPRVGSFFVTRAKANMDAHRIYSATTDCATGIICDQPFALDGFYTRQDYPEHLRRSVSMTPRSAKKNAGLHSKTTGCATKVRP